MCKHCEIACVPLDGVAPALIEWQTDVHPAANLEDIGISLVKLEIFHPAPQRLTRLLSAIGATGPIVVSTLPDGGAPHLVATISTPQALACCLHQPRSGRTMNNKNIPFQTIDWSEIPKTEHKGESGVAYWQTLQFDGLRIRMVEYSPGYKADHWCQKGHIVHCLEGEVINEQKEGALSILTPGMSYVVSDELSSHRSSTKLGVKLLIIDGDFLKLKS